MSDDLLAKLEEQKGELGDLYAGYLTSSDENLGKDYYSKVKNLTNMYLISPEERSALEYGVESELLNEGNKSIPSGSSEKDIHAAILKSSYEKLLYNPEDDVAMNQFLDLSYQISRAGLLLHEERLYIELRVENEKMELDSKLMNEDLDQRYPVTKKVEKKARKNIKRDNGYER